MTSYVYKHLLKINHAFLPEMANFSLYVINKVRGSAQESFQNCNANQRILKNYRALINTHP